ncbi:YybH family protein [Gelidibacter maritimus]|uniref:Nuclear transport factor 2 family protein n=1 Tax=Gelidibacter maritimus TaxID=2761487 RepID=A0A7W2R3Z5_9FLAO|nr:nuclear transport factor 2 family protein [Gelidibacter maritimus]MBA6153178.1 nuclear transport factor 2 family protein [Gelidibacter maritimus]
MRFSYAFLLLFVFSCQSYDKTNTFPSEREARTAIEKVLADQEIAWNNHDLEGFMQGYWKNDSLRFFGSNGLTYGWDKALANYNKGYPSPNESGTLKFVVTDISKIENANYLVFGEYHLERNIGNANGIFTIIFKYIDGQWKIIADMSC